MTDYRIEQIARICHFSIEAAREDGLLESDFIFRNFPH